MNFENLLGKKLKDDDVVEVLETHGMDVVYDFDRTHENIADCYWAAAKPHGFQFRFDGNQTLDVIFLYIAASEGFAPIKGSLAGLPLHATFDVAKGAFEADGVPHLQSAGEKWWIKGDFVRFTQHYQFRDGGLFRITLSAKSVGVGA